MGAGLAQSGSALWARCGQVPNWGLAGQWGPWRERGQSSRGRGSCRLPPAASGDQLAHVAQVNVSFSLSLELLSYQKLPADQMLPGVDIQQHASGEKEMVFTQNLLLEHANQTTQGLVCPGRGLSLERGGSSFLTCLSTEPGQQEPDKDPAAFRVSPNSRLLEAQLVNGPPNTITLGSQAPFLTSSPPPTPHRSSELWESRLVVEIVLSEKACTLQLWDQSSTSSEVLACTPALVSQN
ncbi:deleted in lung and esophageal cancer protein 1-like [Lontra canadensis]|uniref:deleted in lung and esophageal cancer protein 1-like n=1 Tax=Lontra canadensis TaxID=76717 RepID=UPI0013F2BC0A|nr:deleted in lung and esophageal cancer protein 1-like [Lontra canadensis]